MGPREMRRGRKTKRLGRQMHTIFPERVITLHHNSRPVDDPSATHLRRLITADRPRWVTVVGLCQIHSASYKYCSVTLRDVLC